MKMPLGTKIGLQPGHIVLHGEPAPPKGEQPPFSAHVYMAKRSPISATAEHLLDVRTDRQTYRHAHRNTSIAILGGIKLKVRQPQNI